MDGLIFLKIGKKELTTRKKLLHGIKIIEMLSKTASCLATERLPAKNRHRATLIVELLITAIYFCYIPMVLRITLI